MKKLIAGLSLFGFAFFATAQTITFNTTTIDYGTIPQNSDGHREYVVTNTGDKPLIISNVAPSCGCTTPEWTKDPILPGKTGKIKVLYNTAIVAPFQKVVEVYSNDPQNNRAVVHIKGNVVAANTASTAPQTTVVAPTAPAAKAKAVTKKVAKKK